MKIGGGLSYVTGPMGAGKTLWGTRTGVQALMENKYWLTNIRLRDGWEEIVTKHLIRYNPFAYGRASEIEKKLRGHYIYLDAFEDATFIKVPGTGEARAVMIWDEVHNDMNNRDWMESGRKELLKWGTQLRKLGFAGYFLSQHADNTDVSLRRVSSYIIKLQNQREHTRMLGIRVTPWPLFLAFWYPANVIIGKGQPIKTERYFLSWHRHLYDTLDLYHGLHKQHQDNVRVMELPHGGIDPEALAEWTAARRRERIERAAAAVSDASSLKRGSVKSLPTGKMRVVPAERLTLPERGSNASTA